MDTTVRKLKKPKGWKPAPFASVDRNQLELRYSPEDLYTMLCNDLKLRGHDRFIPYLSPGSIAEHWEGDKLVFLSPEPYR